MTVKSISDGYHSVTPYLIINGASRAIEFYQQAFGAKERMRLPGLDGRIGHAEIQIGDSRVMLADESPQRGAHSPQTLGGTPLSLMLYVEDVDAIAARAVAAGAKELFPVKDQFYGDRSGTFSDPFGHVWTIASHREDVSPAELQKRMAAMMQGPSGG
jgi:PhnB protein